MISQIKVSEATGPALDWLVAKAEGYLDDPESWMFCVCSKRDMESFRPSVQWGTGGPIIEREGIWVSNLTGDVRHPRQWGALLKGTMHDTRGPTPLIAAMRCFVASKLGETVEVPCGLLETK